jgi:hypothetical protein
MLFVPDDPRMEAAAEEVPGAAMAMVEVGGVVAVEDLDARGKLRHARLEDQVVVVGHQAEAVHGPAVAANADREQGEKREPVDVVVEDRATVDAARGDVEVAVGE